MNAHSFAVVTCCGGGPEAGVLATHVPVVTKVKTIQAADGTEAQKMELEFHLAKPNEQVQALLSGAAVRVIFSGPHAYISPNWYKNQKTVPTWNYLAIHIEGKAERMRDEQLTRHLDELVKVNETATADGRAGYEPWKLESVGGAGSKFVQGMSLGVVGFVVKAEKVHAKRKLNQNRSREDRLGVIAALRAGGSDNDAAVAQWMERVLEEGEVELDD